MLLFGLMFEVQWLNFVGRWKLLHNKCYYFHPHLITLKVIRCFHVRISWINHCYRYCVLIFDSLLNLCHISIILLNNFKRFVPVQKLILIHQVDRHICVFLFLLFKNLLLSQCSLLLLKLLFLLHLDLKILCSL